MNISLNKKIIIAAFCFYGFAAPSSSETNYSYDLQKYYNPQAAVAVATVPSPNSTNLPVYPPATYPDLTNVNMGYATTSNPTYPQPVQYRDYENQPPVAFTQNPIPSAPPTNTTATTPNISVQYTQDRHNWWCRLTTPFSHPFDIAASMAYRGIYGNFVWWALRIGSWYLLPEALDPQIGPKIAYAVTTVSTLALILQDINAIHTQNCLNNNISIRKNQKRFNFTKSLVFAGLGIGALLASRFYFPKSEVNIELFSRH
jgi:hypothetical protein